MPPSVVVVWAPRFWSEDEFPQIRFDYTVFS